MASRRRPVSRGRDHSFGGDWTSTEVDALAEYLASYTKALKRATHRNSWVDAFTGTGCPD
jgi:hypothetical protein